jgi:hypothetical protein
VGGHRRRRHGGVIMAWQTRDTKHLLDRIDARHAAVPATARAILARMDQRADQWRPPTRQADLDRPSDQN